MNILVCGLSHKTASLPLREKVAFQKDQIPELLMALLAYPDVSQAVILSTCNRTEIYCDAASADAVLEVLLKQAELSADEVASSFYEYHDLDAVRHIMQVACGLDSLVVGEPQILGQMKEAVALAGEYQAMDHRFHTLFQRVFTLAKHVRSTTEIGVCPVSIASIAIQMIQAEVTSLSSKQVLMMGAGETIQLAAKYLKTHEPKNVWVASRSVEKAQALAWPYGWKAISFAQVKDYLSEADVVISGTASELPILGKGSIEQAARKRQGQPMFLMDLAVPRDIEPEVAEIPSVTLRTVDNLKVLAHQHVKAREHASVQAATSVAQHATDYMQWLQSLGSVHMIRAFREHVSELRQAALTQAYQWLAQGVAPEMVLERLANRLTNKLMHEPSVQMRAAYVQGKAEILETVQTLFSIDLPDSSI